MGNANYLIIILGTVILIWLVVLTVFFVKIYVHYRSLLKGVNEGNLEKVLKRFIEREELNRTNIVDINNKIGLLQRQGLSHIQRIGFVRFNPFNETGGDNSFTLCLLDGNWNGVVVTGLHTREKTRMYAKEIEKGKCKYELSKEELRAIHEATK